MGARMHRRDGRRCVVTGGTQGIGLAIATALAGDGGDVLVCSRSERALPTPTRGSLTWVAADLATDAGRTDLLDAAAERFDGMLDVLVNNAGMNINRATVDLSDEELERVLGLDLVAVLQLCRDAYPLLRAGDAPAIVNVSSIAAARYVPAGVAYGVAKAGVDQLTRHLAVEWADVHRDGPIRVNAVRPGYIDTPMNAPTMDDAQRMAQVRTWTPMGRVGQPEEVGAVVAHLASLQASYVTGQVLDIDGGLLQHALVAPPG